MTIVGAFARVDVSDAQAVHRRLSAIDGVSLFDLGDAGKIGMVLETDDLDGAHDKLRAEVRKTKGVLGVWPVYAHFEPEPIEPSRHPSGAR